MSDSMNTPKRKEKEREAGSERVHVVDNEKRYEEVREPVNEKSIVAEDAPDNDIVQETGGVPVTAAPRSTPIVIWESRKSGVSSTDLPAERSEREKVVPFAKPGSKQAFIGEATVQEWTYANDQNKAIATVRIVSSGFSLPQTFIHSKDIIRCAA